MTDGIVLTIAGVSKRFPGVQALDSVSAEFVPGECHALMGENGAGKSTLGKLIAGLYRPDSGVIALNGVESHFGGPLDAQRAGVNIIHQELLFCENLSVAENLCLNAIPQRVGLVNWAEMKRRARMWLNAVGANIDEEAPVGSLPIAQQQLVQIAGAMGSGARVLIFDEPTSSLGLQETERLMNLIRDLKLNGVTCIYVSHRLEEVFEICEKATVLRDGRLVGTVALAETPRDQLVSMMIGRQLENSLNTRAPDAETKEPLLQVKNFSSFGKFSSISFDLHPGEILGIGGLVGAGRTELLEAIFGLDRLAAGQVFLRGKRLDIGDPSSVMAQGVGLVPEDRKRHGLVLPMNCEENITLPFIGELSSFGLIKSKAEYASAGKYFDRMRVKAPSLTTPTIALSGGNQQKIVIAKWLGARCDVLLIDEPTRGVDVGAKAEIHALIRELAADGKAVIVVSSELPELLALSHRILVLHLGRLVGQVEAEKATEESLMRLMTGLIPATA